MVALARPLGLSLAVLAVAAADAETSERRPVPGEVLVRLAPHVTPADLADLGVIPLRSTEPLFHAARSLSSVRRRYPQRARRSPHEDSEDALDRWHRFQLFGDADPREAARSLERIDGVEHAEPNLVLSLDAVPDDTYAGGAANWSLGAWRQSYADLWGMQNIQADRAWDIETGDPSVVVAVVDSGIDFDHQDLQGNLWRNPGEIAGNGVDDDANGHVDDDMGWSFAYDERDVMDRFWHGTHMAGIIGAVGNNGYGIAGVMWHVALMPVKAFNDFGAGTLDDIAAAIRYAADNGADVINLSFSFRGQPSELMRDAIRHAYRSGVVVVASAGNSDADIGECNGGYYAEELVSFPACFKEVVSVGSVDHLDVKTDFSNWGAALDVTAPGGDSEDGSRNEAYKNVLSLRAAQANLENQLTVGGDFYRNRGTSMAAAHVSGLVGLVLSQQPALRVELARSVLQVSAADLGAPGPDGVYGHGRIDAHEALLAADRSLAYPDLLLRDVFLDRGELAPGAPLYVSLEVLNPGMTAAGAFVVELVDESPSGSATIASWDLAGLDPGVVRRLAALVAVTERGIHTLRATVDPADAVDELNEANNSLTRSIGVWSYRFVERRVTSAQRAQDHPRLVGERIVWEDLRNDPHAADIYSFDLVSGLEQRLTDSPWYEEHPAVDGDIVVWQDLREQDPPPGTWDIYFLDLSSGDETRVTTVDTAEVAPDVSGDWIVWMDSRNGLGNSDIYGYTLSGGTEVQLVGSPSNQEDPSIDGDRIVYEDWNDGNGDIGLYEITTGTERLLVTGAANQLKPWIDGDLVVYEDYRHGNAEIYLYDLVTETERRLTDGPSTKYGPSLSEGRVVWQDDRNGGQWDIYLFDLATNEERRVTFDPGIQRRAQVSGRHIVWSDARHADPATGASYEIYATTIDDFPSAPTGLTAVGGEGGISLGWDVPVEPEDDVWRYRIFRADSPAGPYGPVGGTAATNFLDDGLPPGRTFYYRVTAVDRGRSNLDNRHGESPFSAEASATTD